MDYKAGWWRVEKASQESCRAGPSSQPEVSSTQPLSSSSKLRAAAPPTDQLAAGTISPGPPDWVSTSPRAGQGGIWGLRKWAEMRGAGSGE